MQMKQTGRLDNALVQISGVPTLKIWCLVLIIEMDVIDLKEM